MILLSWSSASFSGISKHFDVQAKRPNKKMWFQSPPKIKGVGMDSCMFLCKGCILVCTCVGIDSCMYMFQAWILVCTCVGHGFFYVHVLVMDSCINLCQEMILV